MLPRQHRHHRRHYRGEHGWVWPGGGGRGAAVAVVAVAAAPGAAGVEDAPGYHVAVGEGPLHQPGLSHPPLHRRHPVEELEVGGTPVAVLGGLLLLLLLPSLPQLLLLLLRAPPTLLHLLLHPPTVLQLLLPLLSLLLLSLLQATLALGLWETGAARARAPAVSLLLELLLSLLLLPRIPYPVPVLAVHPAGGEAPGIAAPWWMSPVAVFDPADIVLPDGLAELLFGASWGAGRLGPGLILGLIR